MKMEEIKRKVLSGMGGSVCFSLKNWGIIDILSFVRRPFGSAMLLEDAWNMLHIISELR
jgi:hypothetical protein